MVDLFIDEPTGKGAWPLALTPCIGCIDVEQVDDDTAIEADDGGDGAMVVVTDDIVGGVASPVVRSASASVRRPASLRRSKAMLIEESLETRPPRDRRPVGAKAPAAAKKTLPPIIFRGYIISRCVPGYQKRSTPDKFAVSPTFKHRLWRYHAAEEARVSIGCRAA